MQFNLPSKLSPPPCLVNKLGLDASSLRDSFPPYFIIMPNSDFQNILIYTWLKQKGISQVVLVVNNPPANAGDIRDAGTIPGSGRSSGGGHGNPLQYSCLENPMDRGAWWATIEGSQRVGHD